MHWISRIRSTGRLSAKRIAVLILALWAAALLLPPARSPLTQRRRPSSAHPEDAGRAPRWLLAQRNGEAVIDGATDPNGIPDDRAQSFVLLTAAAAASEPAVARARAASVIGSIRLQSADAPILSSVANRYKEAFVQFVAGRFAGDEAAYEQSRRNLVLNAMSQLKATLTPLGWAQVIVYAQNEKSRMKLVALPDMTQRQAGLWDRIFSLLAVRAQGMTPYGTTYRSQSVTGTVLYASAVTDSSASCSCHQSSAAVTISAPGGTASNSTGLGGAYEVADAQYSLTDADFTDSTIEVNNSFYSYCPIANTAFIDFGIEDWLPLRLIQAYYYYQGQQVYHRCNPNGYCDVVSAWGSAPFPSYALADVAEISIAGADICVGKPVDVVDKCYSPDPKP